MSLNKLYLENDLKERFKAEIVEGHLIDTLFVGGEDGSDETNNYNDAKKQDIRDTITPIFNKIAEIVAEEVIDHIHEYATINFSTILGGTIETVLGTTNVFPGIPTAGGKYAHVSVGPGTGMMANSLSMLQFTQTSSAAKKVIE